MVETVLHDLGNKSVEGEMTGEKEGETHLPQYRSSEWTRKQTFFFFKIYLEWVPELYGLPNLNTKNF